MKKNVALIATAVLVSMASCGPNKAEQDEKARQDSIRTADSLARIQQGSIAGDEEVTRQMIIEDSLEQQKLVDVENIIEFINNIYTPNGLSEIFEEKWIKQHCTTQLQKDLRDQYDFDGEGYAMWILGGWGDGEDVSSKLKEAIFDGEYYYATLVPTGEDVKRVKGERVIRLQVTMENGVPVISDIKWTKDWKHLDSAE